MNTIKTMFGRINANGNVDVFEQDGEPATRIVDVSNIYPVGSDMSTMNEHPAGIELATADANKIGLTIEK